MVGITYFFYGGQDDKGKVDVDFASRGFFMEYTIA